jgi:uncharacterized membrane protein
MQQFGDVVFHLIHISHKKAQKAHIGSLPDSLILFNAITPSFSFVLFVPFVAIFLHS